MPSKSKAQHNLMVAVANNPKFAKKVGIPQKVGKDFAEADKKMNEGGVVKSLKKSGFYEAGKTKPEREKIVSKVTTKPQRISMVEKLFSAKKMASGGLYENIHRKQERIKAGSGERMRKVGSKGAPTAQAFKEAAKTAKMKDGGDVSLAVGRGEKLSTKAGAGLTAKGRAKYNRETGSHLKAPAPSPKTKKDEGRKKSFCARMAGVVHKSSGDAPRAKASLKRWKCPGW
jgi:hypothetical protein